MKGLDGDLMWGKKGFVDDMNGDGQVSAAEAMKESSWVESSKCRPDG